ncbi:class I SAM-dependent methyltransferase [Halobacillus naozhouensis]|uniref:Methyltransferase domain-containing protein n=1 Tax=Halobacillus naozhouensis TaxID=554880 RepID=A0ABY8J1L5_9BACI|nr:class I SAM-dependent methyltransferase [Halobacillus naozhouensis]WFT75976.1 methyltransferase domain-containing protein [Halobacillus naozhouensis]
MKQNKYDDPEFFSAYNQMPRSLKGLEAAGEWPVFKSLLPDLQNKRVLDLGCGYGWHCRSARKQNASTVVGVDISKKMLEKAREQTDDAAISYVQMPMEDIDFPYSQFDVVISSLAFHYIRSFKAICKKVHGYLAPGGSFIFSVEHPMFTSRKEQDWYVDDQGNRLHWPVDNYRLEGIRETNFLGEDVVKYHRTISTYLNNLIEAGFIVKAVEEPMPSDEMIQKNPMMKDENRRPMFLIISVEKIK